MTCLKGPTGRHWFTTMSRCKYCGEPDPTWDNLRSPDEYAKEAESALERDQWREESYLQREAQWAGYHTGIDYSWMDEPRGYSGVYVAFPDQPHLNQTITIQTTNIAAKYATEGASHVPHSPASNAVRLPGPSVSYRRPKGV